MVTDGAAEACPTGVPPIIMGIGSKNRHRITFRHSFSKREPRPALPCPAPPAIYVRREGHWVNPPCQVVGIDTDQTSPTKKSRWEKVDTHHPTTHVAGGTDPFAVTMPSIPSWSCPIPRPTPRPSREFPTCIDLVVAGKDGNGGRLNRQMQSKPIAAAFFVHDFSSAATRPTSAIIF